MRQTKAPDLSYLDDPTADVDESVVVWDREYRETPDGQLDGCTRCQNGLHWQCHGCSCPCSDDWAKFSSDPDVHAAWLASVRRIGPHR